MLDPTPWLSEMGIRYATDVGVASDRCIFRPRGEFDQSADSYLDAAVRDAKIAAGLDPEQAHQPALFHEFIAKDWQRPFWARQVDRVVERDLARGSEEDR